MNSLTETMDKECKSWSKKISIENSQLINTISSNLSSSLNQNLEKVIREVFEKSLIVKLEKAVSAMLLQIHETVDSGMKELLKNSNSTSLEVIQSLFKIQKTLDKLEVQSTSSSTNIPSKSGLDSYFSGQQFQSLVSNVLSNEIRQVMSNQMSLDPSSSSRRWSQLSPTVESKEMELKQEIDLDLESKQYEKAFTAALGSSDLSIVLVITLSLCMFLKYV